LASDGLSGGYVMRFEGSDGYRYKVIEGSFNCSNGNATLTKIQSLDDDLNVKATLNAGEISPDGKVLQGSGWTLNESGTTTCQDLTSN
jgi:hypothetical protein